MTEPSGRSAISPLHIPPGGWLDVLYRVVHRALSDRMSSSAAGAAFNGLLALVPGVVAGSLVAATVLDTDQVEGLLESYGAVVPLDLRQLVYRCWWRS